MSTEQGNAQPAGLNTFDPAHLRLSQNFTEAAGAKKLLTTVPVRRPDNQTFVRVHPSEDYRFETLVLELKEERETYLVARELWPELGPELIPKALITTTTRQGALLLWPIRLPGPDGRQDPWNESALLAAERARTQWVRVSANRQLGCYDVSVPVTELPEPEFPEEPFERILEIAFRGRYIQSLDHPVVLRLRGAA